MESHTCLTALIFSLRSSGGHRACGTGTELNGVVPGATAIPKPVAVLAYASSLGSVPTPLLAGTGANSTVESTPSAPPPAFDDKLTSPRKACLTRQPDDSVAQQRSGEQHDDHRGQGSRVAFKPPSYRAE